MFIMAQAISIEIYQLLEEKLGKEEAAKVASAIEVGFEVIERKAEAVALQKKIELKDELTKELATKTDLQVVKTELEGKIENEILRIDRKFTIMFIVLFFSIVFLNQNALEFLAKIFGLIK